MGYMFGEEYLYEAQKRHEDLAKALSPGAGLSLVVEIVESPEILSTSFEGETGDAQVDDPPRVVGNGRRVGVRPQRPRD